MGSIPRFLIPATLFASWFSDQVSFATIKLYLAGIRFAHIENSLAEPFADAPPPLLHLLLRGIKRANGLSSRCRLPITMSAMRQLKGVLADDPQFTSQDKLMLWSAFTLAFFGFLRSSEFTSPSSSYFNLLVDLSRSDISCTTHGSLNTAAKVTQKLFPFGRVVPSHSLPPAGRYVPYGQCTITWITSLPAVPPHPLFYWAISRQRQSHLSVTPPAPTLRFPQLVLCFPQFSHWGCNYRCRGWPTSWLIQILGRWSSNCYVQYIRTPASILQTAAAKLATRDSTPQQSWDPSTGLCRPF